MPASWATVCLDYLLSHDHLDMTSHDIMIWLCYAIDSTYNQSEVEEKLHSIVF